MTGPFDIGQLSMCPTSITWTVGIGRSSRVTDNYIQETAMVHGHDTTDIRQTLGSNSLWRIEWSRDQ